MAAAAPATSIKSELEVIRYREAELTHGRVGMLASLGFLVNISSFLVIKEVGSVALKVLGTARNAGLVLFSALVMGEATTPLEIGGYDIALLGFAAFNYAKIAGL